MPSFPFNLPNIPRLTLTAAIDILIVAVLVYQLLMILRGRRAFPILFGVLFLAVIYVIAAWAQLELLRSILAGLVPYTGVALIVMFQSELRRMLARIGRTHFFRLGGRMQRRELGQEIVMAVTQLSQNKVGVLIVVERDIGLKTFIESGVALDAYISGDLLCAIFEKNGALHDGAVIIQRDRVAAAACFLPLSMNPNLAGELGTRHRAAIGITEEADCISVIVSEETGRIGIAAFGEIEVDVTPKRVEERLALHSQRKDPKPSEREFVVRETGTLEAPGLDRLGESKRP